MRDDDPAPLGALRATFALDEALSRLDQAVEAQARHLKTLTDLSARVAALSAQEGPAPPDRAGRLKTLHLRVEATRKQLDKARKTLAAERERTRDALADGCDAVARHATLLTELQGGIADRARSNAALARALQRQFHRQCARAAEDAGGAGGFTLPDGSYDYIAIGIDRFLSLLARLDLYLGQDPAYACDDGRYRPVSFLEVGCGPGHNLELARSAGLCRFATCTGFDINPEAVEMGRRAFGLGDAIAVGDALEADYSGADVIYSFRPFSDETLQTRLERRIAEAMRPGAYLIAPMALDLGLYPALVPTGDSGEIWRKAG